MSREPLESPVTLTGGRWVTRGLIVVWEADPTVLPEPESDHPADQIACPYCLAKASERCRTASGGRSGPHPQRILPRCCPCGGELSTRAAVICRQCRADRIRENNKVANKMLRARYRAQRLEAS